MNRALRSLCNEYFPKRKLAVSGYPVSHMVKLALAFIAPFIIKNLIDVVLPKGDVTLLTLCANIDVASNEGGIYALFEVSQGKYFEASTAT